VRLYELRDLYPQSTVGKRNVVVPARHCFGVEHAKFLDGRPRPTRSAHFANRGPNIVPTTVGPSEARAQSGCLAIPSPAQNTQYPPHLLVPVHAS